MLTCCTTPKAYFLAAHSNRPAAAKVCTLEEVFSSHDVAAYLSGHLHDVFGDRLHGLAPKPGGGQLADLETADWKLARRFR